MPKVSVLLTCYNHLAYLPACLEGVLAQTFQDFEIIILDDGSSDGTREWLKERVKGWKGGGVEGLVPRGADSQSAGLGHSDEGTEGQGNSPDRPSPIAHRDPAAGDPSPGSLSLTDLSPSGRGDAEDRPSPIAHRGTSPFAPRPSPIKLIFNETNLGTYGTLNRGLKEATGEYIAVLNDDDLWAPEKLERQLALFEAHPEVGLVHTDGWFIDGKGERMEGSPLGFSFPRTQTGDVLLALLYANKIIASAALVRRECFEKLGGFNEAYFGSGDWEMWLRVAEQWQVGYVDEPLTFYRVHGANASHKLERIWKDDEMLREWIRTRYPLLEARGYPSAELVAAKAHNEACLGTVKTLNGDPAGGRAAFARSIKLAPGRWKSYLRWAATFLPRGAFRKLN
ncbi:MAG: glycosyltransferase [Armatimonadetes bacterium]|nr:glycosyltransferase [Armatimonadota bacterium]